MSGEHELIQVTVRTEDMIPNEGIFLRSWPISELDELVEAVKSWGVSIEGRGYFSISGHFVTVPGRVVFELIAHDE